MKLLKSKKRSYQWNQTQQQKVVAILIHTLSTRVNFSTTSNTWFTSGIFVWLLVGVDPADEQDDGDGVSRVDDDSDWFVNGETVVLAVDLMDCPSIDSSKGLKVVTTHAAAIRLGENDEKTSCAEHMVMRVSECFLNDSGVIPMMGWNCIFLIRWIMCSTKSKAITADMSQSNLDKRSTSHS